jgi:LPXTG-motif cell wall-anchored protein
MKRVVLAIAAALVLIALPAAAQYDTNASNTQPTTNTQGTTTTQGMTDTPSSGLTNTQQPTETRTNPAVPTHSQDPGLTAQGTVVSWNDDEVVLRTSTGLTHFKLMPNTVGSRTFTEGQSLAIDFQRNEQGVLLARQIRLADATTAPAPGVTTSGAATAGQAVEDTADEIGEDLSRVDDAVEEEVEEAVGTSIDNDGAIGNDENPANDTSTTATTTTTTDTSLPATGSNAPLAGLLGLLALGGAAALRRL